jgi:uncharacterized protein (TIGR02118 family)
MSAVRSRHRPPESREGEVMIKVSVLYPHQPGGKFDMNYYLTKHMPMVRQRLGSALKGVSVEQGISGGPPNSPPPFVTMCHLLFDSVAAHDAAVAPHEAELKGDITNFTNIEPRFQFSEVKL